MAFHFLIDGYNLLHQLRFRGRAAETDFSARREAMLRFLADKRPQGRNPVTVVFDGSPGRRAPGAYPGLRVVFSGAESADARIAALVRELPHPASLRVVSDDRELQRLARGTGAEVLGIRAFLSGVRTRPPAAGRGRISSDEMTDINEELRQVWLKDPESKG